MKPFKWQCPHCNHHTTITDRNFCENKFGLTIENKEGPKLLYSFFIVCPNNECNKYTLFSKLYDTKYDVIKGSWQHYDLKEIKQWSLVPNSFAKVFPDYVPEAIIKDYEEACSIVNESPKASATLSRRCLQGMIRNFWSIKEATLYKEIEGIKDKVDPLTWQSIDATRKIGNIGAHMEKNINLIIDVETSEAKALINLIEILIKDWYITKNERQTTLEKIIKIGKEKSDLKKENKE
ncbi:MAG: DUF4145 domain-containing protein [Bacteroidales bacterium]|nr:DUF4145 domain-containing protein [Bacteroidales bacterium]